MQLVEERYAKDFIDNKVNRNGNRKAEDGDLKNYHRVGKVYWLQFIKQEDMKELPYL